MFSFSERNDLSSCIGTRTEDAYINLKNTCNRYVTNLISLVTQTNPTEANNLQTIKDSITTLIGKVPKSGQAFHGKPLTGDLVAITKWLKSSFPQRMKSLNDIRHEMRKFREILNLVTTISSTDVAGAFDEMIKALNQVDSMLLSTYNCFPSYFKGEHRFELVKLWIIIKIYSTM